MTTPSSSLLPRAEGKVRMFSVWRRAVIVAFAASVAITVQLAAAPAQASTPTISIAAASKFKPVTGDVYVAYHDGSLSSATVHGAISGAVAGEVALLYAQPFPYKAPAVRVNSHTITAGETTYSFTVRPTLGTRYAVRLFAAGQAGVTGATPLAVSPTQNLYVVGNGFWTGGQSCGTSVCHQTLHQYVVVPAAALTVEISKPLLPYFGLTLKPPGHVAPPPKWLYLRQGHASVSAAQRISSIEFVRTITYSFTVGTHSYDWAWRSCLRDTASKDGIGLPGAHGCGGSRVLRTVSYLG